MYYRNDNTSSGNPTRPMDFWNYLNHRWRDGKPLTYGKGSTDTASFAFPQTEDLAGRSKWSEETDSLQPGDRVFLMPIGPVQFKANTALTLDYAIVYSRSIEGGAWASVEKLTKDVAKVKYWFNAGQFPSCYDDTKNGIAGFNKPTFLFTVFPNPVSNQLFIKTERTIPDKTRYKIYNHLGQLVMAGIVNRYEAIHTTALNSGVYFIQLETPVLLLSTRFVIAR